jgi:DNA/RNA-binding domain of Phe-tRNA-synthetase-like protein
MCFIPDPRQQTQAYTEIAVAPAVRESLAGAKVFGQRYRLARKVITPPDLRPHWETLHQVWRGKSRKAIEGDAHVVAYRKFYASLGLDPDRTAPSVQTLTQRYLRADVLTKTPTINQIVDSVNVAAVEAMIPLGVFDAATVVGEIVIDRSAGGEPFSPIGGDGEIALPAGMVVLRDNEKVLSQFCHRDGEAQKITANTRAIWLLGCQVPSIEASAVTGALSRAFDILRGTYSMEAY